MKKENLKIANNLQERINTLEKCIERVKENNSINFCGGKRDVIIQKQIDNYKTFRIVVDTSGSENIPFGLNNSSIVDMFKAIFINDLQMQLDALNAEFDAL